MQYHKNPSLSAARLLPSARTVVIDWRADFMENINFQRGPCTPLHARVVWLWWFARRCHAKSHAQNKPTSEPKRGCEECCCEGASRRSASTESAKQSKDWDRAKTLRRVGAGTVKFLPMVAEGEPKSVIRRCTTTTPRGFTYRSLHRVVVNHGRNNANMRQTSPLFDTVCKAPSWSFLEVVSTGTIVSRRVFPETPALYISIATIFNNCARAAEYCHLQGFSWFLVVHSREMSGYDRPRE